MGHQRHQSVDAAVERMTEAAQSEGKNQLIMTAPEWTPLVLGMKVGVRDFGIEMVNRAADVDSIDVVNRWLALALDIWNAMPGTIRRLDLRRMEGNRLDDRSYAVPVGATETDDLADYADDGHSERECARPKMGVQHGDKGMTCDWRDIGD